MHRDRSRPLVGLGALSLVVVLAVACGPGVWSPALTASRGLVRRVTAARPASSPSANLAGTADTGPSLAPRPTVNRPVATRTPVPVVYLFTASGDRTGIRQAQKGARQGR